MSQYHTTLNLILELLNRLTGLVQSLFDAEQPPEAPSVPFPPPQMPSQERELVDVPSWITISNAQVALGAEYWVLSIGV